MIHFSDKDTFLALRNICRSQGRYLLTTIFTSTLTNLDIETGQWRALNLQGSPFGLPTPLKLIVEECSEGGGRYKDKSMGLWRVADILAAIK